MAATVTGSELAAFDSTIPEGVEDFEEEWSNDTYQLLFQVIDLDAADFDSGGEALEDFEEGWDNDTWTGDPSAITPVIAMFDTAPQNVEDFEEEWLSNENWVGVPGGVTVTAVMFDTTPQSFEDFEEEWRENENWEFNNPSVSLAIFSDDGTPPRETFEGATTFVVSTTPGSSGDEPEIDDSLFVEVSITGTFVAELQVQGKFQGVWQDVGSALTAPGSVTVPDDRKAVRVMTVAYTSGSPSANYTWGEMTTI